MYLSLLLSTLQREKEGGKVVKYVFVCVYVYVCVSVYNHVGMRTRHISHPSQEKQLAKFVVNSHNNRQEQTQGEQKASRYCQ